MNIEKSHFEKMIIQTIFTKHWNVLLIVFATVARIMIQVCSAGHESGDWIYDYSLWYQQLKANGGIFALGLNIGDYSPGFNLLLALLTYIPILPYLAFKLLVLLFNFICGVSCYFITKEINANFYDRNYYASISYAIVLLLPSIFLNAAVWVQTDCIWVAFCLISTLYIIKNKFSCALFL